MAKVKAEDIIQQLEDDIGIYSGIVKRLEKAYGLDNKEIFSYLTRIDYAKELLTVIKSSMV